MWAVRGRTWTTSRQCRGEQRRCCRLSAEFGRADLRPRNGATARLLAAEGWEVAGVDPLQEGVTHARANGVVLRVGSAYEDLANLHSRGKVVLATRPVTTYRTIKAREIHEAMTGGYAA